MDGSKVKRSIHELDPLLAPLSLYGSHVLRKLILRFVSPPRHLYYYPYGNHNVVIEQSHTLRPFSFHIQFYHYYNVKNEKVEIPLEQKFYDYCAVEQFLFQYSVLYHAFHRRLLRPSFPSFSPLLRSLPPSSPSSPSSLSPSPSPSPSPAFSLSPPIDYQEHSRSNPNSPTSYHTVCVSTSH
jgi:hypothetical protein